MIPGARVTELQAANEEPDRFDLDIRVLESGDEAAALINLTDDGCGSTCASPCATNMG